MEMAHRMIKTAIGEIKSVAPVESPNTKRQCDRIANITSLTGLLTVGGMLVTQGMCSTAVDAQIQDLIAAQANI
jgi:hypothetical protein